MNSVRVMISTGFRFSVKVGHGLINLFVRVAIEIIGHKHLNSSVKSVIVKQNGAQDRTAQLLCSAEELCPSGFQNLSFRNNMHFYRS